MESQVQDGHVSALEFALWLSALVLWGWGGRQGKPVSVTLFRKEEGNGDAAGCGPGLMAGLGWAGEKEEGVSRSRKGERVRGDLRA